MLGGKDKKGISSEASAVFESMATAGEELKLKPMENAIWKAMARGASQELSENRTEHEKAVVAFGVETHVRG